MQELAGPTFFHQSPLRRLGLLAVLFVAAIVSCGKDVTGPLGSAARYVHGLAFNPVFPPAFQVAGGSGVVQFNKVHVVLHHSDGTVALDTTIDFPVGQDSLTVDLTVKLLDNAPTTGEPMSLNLGYLDASGNIVFQGGPVSVTAAPPSAPGVPNPPVQVPVIYTGPGATAVSVAVSPRSLTVNAGGTFSFGASAKDASGNAIAAPIIWNSLDPSIATVSSAAAGSGVAGLVRGTARIQAQLLTGATDIATVNVVLPASQLILASGGAQTGIVGATLASPLVAKVAASDGIGVSGVTVNFAVASGGGSVGSSSAVSDANGLAQTTFKLGTSTGAQTVTASAASLTGSPITFSATATAATATKLVVTSGPSNGVAGIGLSPAVFVAQDDNGNVATTFTGAVSIAIGANAAGGALSGATTVNAVAGIATFSGLTINKTGSGYTLVASSGTLVGATTGAFDIAAGAPSKLVFTTQPAAATAHIPMGTIVVSAQDSQGNPTPSFTGTVSLAFAANPGGAALGGTLSVGAVAGAATFSGITVSAPGTGYSLAASSGTLTGATSAAFNVGGGVAASISVASGGGQTGAISSALAQPVVIQVTDVGANPVAGTTVNFAVVTGGGSVLPVSGVSNALGQVQTTWTLGATVGAQSISATSGTLTNSPLTINATGTSSAATQLKFTVQPAASTQAGANISPAIVVQARDAGNALVPTFTGNVTLTIAANPGASTLGGTVTVAAVGGVATFNAIILNKTGVGYTLSATSGALTPDVSTTFNIIPGPAANLAITGGQAQSGPTGSALPTSLQVTVTDANANAVSGTTVNWTTPSGGSMSPTSSGTNAAGVASTVWTLGATPGAQTATATSGSLVGSPAPFTATATSSFASKTWTGATNNQWAVGTNWAPAGAPSATDSVSIPVVATFPTISASTIVGGLTIAPGATLTLAGGSVTLTDNGVLDATGAITGGGNVLLIPSPAVPRLLRGVIGGAVTISGTYGMNGPLTVTGNVVINSGAVGFNNNPFTVNGNFSTTSTGALTMVNPGDVLSVFGSATFAGATGSITNGTINLTGGFVQNVSAASFAASGANTVVFSGTVSQSVIFSNTGASHFQNVQVTNAAGVAMATNGVVMNGNVVIGVGGISGAGVTLNIGGTLTDPSGLLTVPTVSFSGSTTPISATTHTVHPAVTFSNNPSTMQGDVLFTNNVFVTGGNLQINGHKIGVGGGFSTTATGQLTMTNSADSLGVGGDASFGGGVEAGILTAGNLVLNGNFAQTNNGNAQEFKASAGHTTTLVGAGAQTVSFANPDTTATVCSLSCFGDFTINKPSGTVTFTSPAGANGNVNVKAGVTAVTAGSSNFLLVRGSTLTANGTNVHVARFGTFGAITFAPDSSTLADTIQFHGNATQTIPVAEYNEVVIKGTPTLSAGGFLADGNLTVDGGTLTLGGNEVDVSGGFLTFGSGTLVMTNSADRLLVVGQATFNGGAESGKLTNGELVLFQGIMVSGAGQFSASGSHVTYLVGPNFGCDCTDLVPAHHGTISASASRSAPRSKALLKAFIAARRAKALAGAKLARSQKAALQAARKALASKWTPSTSGIRLAAAAGKNARLPHTIQPRALAMNKSRSLGDVRINAPRIGAPRAPISAGGRQRASNILVQAYSDSAVYVAFMTPSGNQFGNVRIVGEAQWVTLAAAAGNVQLDTTADLSGDGHLTVGGALTGPSNSSLELEAIEMFGAFADSGAFQPDTTIFSGTSPTMPFDVGGTFNVTYNNVVVNSPALGVPANDGDEINVFGSLFIQNSGVLRVGVPIGACGGCESDELFIHGALETHGSGALQMTDANDPYVVVYGDALFAGGSTSGLLTSGEIDYLGNFTQSGPAATAYAAVTPHESYIIGDSLGTDTITFANPGNAASHFGDFYLASPTSILNSNAFAVGQLETGDGSSFTVHGAVDRLITSNGSDLRNIVFDNVRWKTAGTDGNGVFNSLDNVTFQNISATTLPQFDFEYSVTTNLSLPGFTFSTVPTGAGVYIKVVGPDTLTMSTISPAVSGGFVSVSGGGAINGWPSAPVDMWLGSTGTWTDPTNWSLGVPTSSSDVQISCDCSTPTTPGAIALHNLTITNGNQLGLGGQLTVNGDLSVQSGSDINVSTANLVLRGNVTMDPTASPGGVFCGSGTTGAMLTGTGTQNVTGKFCRLTVSSTTVASGRIYVKNTSNYGSALTIQTGGSLDLNGHSVETDSMNTSGTGTITMTHALDSLIIHGASGAFAVNFNGGSETGLMTNGTVLLRSPNFRANGTAFDAAGGLNTVVADTTGGQTFRWTGATVGHGFNNLTLKNSNFDSFQQDLVVTGTLTLDASMGTSGQFAATANNLYAGRLVDNTGHATGGFAGAYWIHLTQSGAAPAFLPVDSIFFESGGNMQLANDVTTGGVVVVRPDAINGSNTGLLMNGHRLFTTNHNFITTGTAFLDMHSNADSLNVGTASVYFNGGDGFGSQLAAGGIAAGGFYQGYTNTTTLASGAAASSYNPSGTHRLWLTANAPIIFANPGTGASASHFNSLHNPSGFTTTLYSDVFVDDSIYFATTGTAIFNSDQPNTAGKTRLVTTKGLADNTISNGISFNNVVLKFVDGQVAPSNFSNVQWLGFPLLYSGTVFEIARTTGSAIGTMSNYDFASIGISGLLGHAVSNTGTVNGWSFTSVTAGLLSILTSFTLNAGNVFP